MSNNVISPYAVMHISYIRDGKLVHTGDAVTLACLLRAKGKSRKSEDMTELQKIMKDQNINS